MKNRFLYPTIYLLIGIFISFLYTKVVLYNPGKWLFYTQEINYLEQGKTKFSLNLKSESLFLRVKFQTQLDQPVLTYVNQKLIRPNIGSGVRKKKVTETLYFYLPKSIINNGDNLIEIRFPKNYPPNVFIKLSNYRNKLVNSIFVFFPDSLALSSRSHSFLDFIFLTVFTFIILMGSSFIHRMLFPIDERRIFLNQIYSILPFSLILITLIIANSLNFEYVVRVSQNYFYSFFVVIILLFQGFQFAFNLFKYKEKDGFLHLNNNSRKYLHLSIDFWESHDIPSWLLIISVASIVFCAVVTLLNINLLAVQAANIAYLFLSGGILLKLFKVFKTRR